MGADFFLLKGSVISGEKNKIFFPYSQNRTWKDQSYRRQRSKSNSFCSALSSYLYCWRSIGDLIRWNNPLCALFFLCSSNYPPVYMYLYIKKVRVKNDTTLLEMPSLFILRTWNFCRKQCIGETSKKIVSSCTLFSNIYFLQIIGDSAQ